MKQKDKDKSTEDLIKEFIEEKEKSKQALRKFLNELIHDSPAIHTSDKKHSQNIDRTYY